MCKKRWFDWAPLALGLACCAAMLWVDGVWQPGYGVKSLVKMTLFLALPLWVMARTGKPRLKDLFRPERSTLRPAMLQGVALYALIVCGYFVLKNWVDFSGIAGNLSQTAGVTADNFLWVSLYISFVNSLLEEFFFRGFVFYGLEGQMGPLPAGAFSALCFSLYHTAMMAGWFPLPLFLLALAGLAAGGALFIALDRKTGTLYPSWFVHMFANFAINTVGFLLL